MAGPSRAPQRRALVIGVNYAANESWTTLDRGQEDARLFRRHLIGAHLELSFSSDACSDGVGAEHRGWSADDIGLMLDLPVGEFPYRAGDRPTQNNIVSTFDLFIRLPLIIGPEEKDPSARPGRHPRRPLRLLLSVHLSSSLRDQLIFSQSPATPPSCRVQAGAKRMAWTKVRPSVRPALSPAARSRLVQS
jgi:hypothetical protein